MKSSRALRLAASFGCLALAAVRPALAEDAGAYDARFVSQAGPRQLHAGGSGRFTFSFANTGREAWRGSGPFAVSADEFPVDLAVNVGPNKWEFSPRDVRLAYDPIGKAYLAAFINTSSRDRDAFDCTVRGARLKDGRVTVSERVQAREVTDEYGGYAAPAWGVLGRKPRALVVWVDTRNGKPGRYGRPPANVYGQFFEWAPDGVTPVRAGKNFVIDDSPDLLHRDAAVAFDETSGKFLVAWSDSREVQQREQGWVAWARTVTPEGKLGPVSRVSGTDPWPVITGVVAAPGRVLALWWDYVSVNGKEVQHAHARLLSSVDASPIGPVLLLAEGTQAASLLAGAAMRDRDQFAVVYVRNSRIVGQVLSGRGEGVKAETQITDDPNGAGGSGPCVAYSEAAGRLLVTYGNMATANAFLREVSPDLAAGPPQPLQTGDVKLGTYYVPVVADPESEQAVVMMQRNWTQIVARVVSATPGVRLQAAPETTATWGLRSLPWRSADPAGPEPGRGVAPGAEVTFTAELAAPALPTGAAALRWRPSVGPAPFGATSEAWKVGVTAPEPLPAGSNAPRKK